MNIPNIPFQVSFYSDGSDTVSFDLVRGPVVFGEGEAGLVIVPSSVLASGVDSVSSPSTELTISSAVIERGVLTITFSTPPSSGQGVSITGNVQFA
jgi:hypothetical protein